MTEDQLQYAAKTLLKSKNLSLTEDHKYLPKIFVVNGKCYWFLNVARRAAYGSPYPIEVLTIVRAWNICNHSMANFDRNNVLWDFDTTGSTYNNGLLFSDFKRECFIKASRVMNPIITARAWLVSPLDILDDQINRLTISKSATLLLERIECITYRDLLHFTRMQLLNLDKLNVSAFLEIDDVMNHSGLLDYWRYGKPLNNL